MTDEREGKGRRRERGRVQLEKEKESKKKGVRMREDVRGVNLSVHMLLSCLPSLNISWFVFHTGRYTLPAEPVLIHGKMVRQRNTACLPPALIFFLFFFQLLLWLFTSFHRRAPAPAGAGRFAQWIE